MVMIIELLLLFDGWNAVIEKLDTVSYLRSLLVNFSFLAVELYSFDKIQAKCCLFQIKYTRMSSRDCQGKVEFAFFQSLLKSHIYNSFMFVTWKTSKDLIHIPPFYI